MIYALLQPKTMKALLISSVFFLLLACGTQKEVIVNTDSNSQIESNQAIDNTITNTSDTLRIIGTVRTTSKGCLVYIDAQTNSRSIKMYPVNLDDRFKKEGMFIRFTYALSRGMQPKGCECNQIVSVSDVTRLRKCY